MTAPSWRSSIRRVARRCRRGGESRMAYRIAPDRWRNDGRSMTLVRMRHDRGKGGNRRWVGLQADMDIVRIPGSRIFEIAKLAFATPDVDFLCFGESDQPSPRVAHNAAVAALDAGETKYIDVRGLPA